MRTILQNRIKINRLCYGALVLMATFIVIGFHMASAEAGVWDNAYTYYNKYSNNSVFKATDSTDGYIYCATKGNMSSSSIKYKTIGWKMKLKDYSGKALQTLYFKLGGNYLVMNDQVEKNNYDYRLYSISLYTLKKRMTEKTLEYIEAGDCQIVLDACMVVVKNGSASGKMNDSGITSGDVYTTYNQIVKAADWSSSAKSSLKTYFGKDVEGLFADVVLEKTAGIKKVYGEGEYCHGTVVEISATASPGYSFDRWEGPKNVTTEKHKIIVNVSKEKDLYWTAYAKEGRCTVNYFCNRRTGDAYKIQKYYFQTHNDQKYEKALLPDSSSTKTGYFGAGWSENKNANTVQYAYNSTIDSKDLIKWGNQKDLYQVWQPNSYTLNYIDKTGDVLHSKEVYYTDSEYILSKNDIKQWIIFLPDGKQRVYKAGESFEIRQVASALGIENNNGQKIDLYAANGMEPIISAADLYYSLSFAKKGKITENELARHAKAYDEEDGTILYGRNNSNGTSFYILDYNSSFFTKLNDDTRITITYKAIDSEMHTVSKEVTIHIIKEGISVMPKQIRFIDQTFYGKPENKGGLFNDSIWKNKKEYIELIQKALDLKIDDRN